MSDLNLKQRIRAGEILIGVSVPLDASESEMEAIISKDDYAFVFTDSQHGPFNEETLVRFCEASSSLGIPSQFRIKHTRHTYLIGNILDLGPVGIEVPQVETLETVQEAVHYFYYPQKGGRSVGGAARYKINDYHNNGLKDKSGPGSREVGFERIEYGKWWNQTGFLSIQMESLRAVTTVSQLAVDGVDCLTWGPNDLLYDIEAHPKHPIQTVDDCVTHALDQLQGSQTRISFRSYDHTLRNKYINMGVTVLMEHPK